MHERESYNKNKEEVSKPKGNGDIPCKRKVTLLSSDEQKRSKKKKVVSAEATLNAALAYDSARRERGVEYGSDKKGSLSLQKFLDSAWRKGGSMCGKPKPSRSALSMLQEA
jgi:hypothetical protein